MLSGHRGMAAKEMFRNIDSLYEGDVFYIHGKTGTLKYRVTQQRVIYPHETKYLDIEKDKDMFTLLTCHPYRYNYQRLLIHGERIEEHKHNKANSLKPKKEKNWESNTKIIISSIIVLLLFIIIYEYV